MAGDGNIPPCVLVDTCVLIRALDRQEPESRAFLERASNEGIRLLVTALSLAEFELPRGGNPSTPLPRIFGMEIVPFDMATSNIYTRYMSLDGIKNAVAAGTNRHIFKFDSMIVACGVRHRADCVVSTDDGIKKVCEKFSIPFRDLQSFHRPPPRLHPEPLGDLFNRIK